MSGNHERGGMWRIWVGIAVVATVAYFGLRWLASHHM